MLMCAASRNRSPIFRWDSHTHWIVGSRSSTLALGHDLQALGAVGEGTDLGLWGTPESVLHRLPYTEGQYNFARWVLQTPVGCLMLSFYWLLSWNQSFHISWEVVGGPGRKPPRAFSSLPTPAGHLWLFISRASSPSHRFPSSCPYGNFKIIRN